MGISINLNCLLQVVHTNEMLHAVATRSNCMQRFVRNDFVFVVEDTILVKAGVIYVTCLPCGQRASNLLPVARGQTKQWQGNNVSLCTVFPSGNWKLMWLFVPVCYGLSCLVAEKFSWCLSFLLIPDFPPIIVPAASIVLQHGSTFLPGRAQVRAFSGVHAKRLSSL
jgi:hypothetical protein